MPLRTVPLSAILSRPGLDMELLTGADQVHRPVCWAHVSELRDPVPFLLGDELLLTAGVDFPRTPEEIDGYVAGLVGAGVSALGFGVTPYYDEVPAALLSSCVERGLPLLAVPPRTPFLAVSQAAGAAIAEAQSADLRAVANAQLALTRASVRADPVAGTLRALARALGCWALLLDRDGVPLTGVRRPTGLDEDTRRLAAAVAAGSGPRSASTQVGADHVVLQPVETSTQAVAVVAVGRATRLTAGERAILAIAVSLLGLLRREGDHLHGRTAQLSTRAVLDGPEAAAQLLGELLDSRDGRCRIARAERVWRRSGAKSTSDYERLRDRLNTALVDIDGDLMRAVLPADRPPSDADLRALHRAGWLVAVGPPGEPTALADADRYAASLLTRAHATGAPLRVDSADRRMESLVDDEAARRYAAALLAPLDSAGPPGGKTLVATLHAWLAEHGSWDRSAATLGVHRNTVRHRIAQIGRLLDLDLSDPQHRADLWYAVAWRRS